MPRIIDIVEFIDETGTEIIHREPQDGPGDFRFGSQVIVREGQIAVFFRDGKALDTFTAGRHTLTTYNIPLLAEIVSKFIQGGNTPFPAEVIFVSLRQFLDQKWGTPQPITFRDSDLGMARLRARGSYAFQVSDPTGLVNGIVGQRSIYGTTELNDYLRGIIIQRFLDVLGEQKRSVLDLPGLYGEISSLVREQLNADFGNIGLKLTAFYLEAITPTEEAEKAIDERASMGAIGDMNAYMKFRAARALGDAANQGGDGSAGTGVGLGAGMGMGVGMAQMIGQAFQQPQQPAAAAAPSQAPTASTGVPTSVAEVRQAIDSLDMRFARGEVTEDVYNRMLQRLEARLKELGQP